MKWNLNIDLRDGRAVKRGSTAMPGRPVVLSPAQSRALGSLSAHLQSDIGVVQSRADTLPRVASEEWWRWPALGR
jgi:hypothetical protein